MILHIYRLDVKMVYVSLFLIMLSVAGLGCKAGPLQIPVSRMVEQEVVPYEYIGIGARQGKNPRIDAVVSTDRSSVLCAGFRSVGSENDCPCTGRYRDVSRR